MAVTADVSCRGAHYEFCKGKILMNVFLFILCPSGKTEGKCSKEGHETSV